jgi:hypothetical protein
MEHVKSAGSWQSIMVKPKWTVVIEEMENLLKIWLGDKSAETYSNKSGHYFS